MARNATRSDGAYRLCRLAQWGLTTQQRREAGGGRATGSRLTYCFTLIKPSYSIRCSLPEQALLATAGSEASGTTRSGRQPREDPARLPLLLQASCGSIARLVRRVNTCELLIKRRYRQQAKDAERPEPKRYEIRLLHWSPRSTWTLSLR